MSELIRFGSEQLPTIIDWWILAPDQETAKEYVEQGVLVTAVSPEGVVAFVHFHRDEWRQGGHVGHCMCPVAPADINVRDRRAAIAFLEAHVCAASLT